jgi:tetratricopeptide (TPR) repeat protein
MDLAAQTWQQVLLIDPNNAEALGGIAKAAALRGDSALAETYIERLRRINPNDPSIAVVARLERSKVHSNSTAAASSSAPHMPATTPHLGPAEAAAYQALNAKRVDEAEAGFKAILEKNPNNESALAGMGYVRMQQGIFLGAISFLEQARQEDPKDKTLAAALDTCRFWFILGEGKEAVKANDLAEAEKRYRGALDLRPESPEALVGLGTTLLKAQQPSAAAPFFDRATAVQPNSDDAWSGLFLAQLRSNDANLALTTERRMPADVLKRLKQDPSFLQSLASAEVKAGRYLSAQADLQSAISLQGSSPANGAASDLQLQLAGVLLASGKADQAAGLYRQVLTANGTDTEAMKGLAEAEHALGHEDQALATVQTMPPANYAAAMHDPAFELTVAAIDRAENKLDAAQEILQRVATQESTAGQRPSPAIEIQLADIDIQQGKPQLAYPIYQQLVREQPQRADAWAGLLTTLHLTGHDEAAVAQLPSIPSDVRTQLQGNVGYLQTMAAVYAAQGRPAEATQFLGRVQQSYTAQRIAPPADLEIQNAWLLYNAMDDVRLYRLLMSLGQRTDLTEPQRRNVQTIWTDWAVRRAGQDVSSGRNARAIAILNAAAQSFPDNPAVLRELANAYTQAGQPQQAVLIYRSENMSSASSADYQSAVNAALAANDTKDAETWLRAALAKYPADAEILLLGARYEQARGDTARAMQYYRASLKAMPPETITPHPALPGAPSPIGLPGSSPEQTLSLLLAPNASDTADTARQAPPMGLSEQSVSVPNASAQPMVPPYMTATQPSLGPDQHPEDGSSSMQSGSQPSMAVEEPYRPFVPYIAPPGPTPPVSAIRNGTPVQVQLGNSTPPPVQPQMDRTDVLPTAHYVPGKRTSPALMADPGMAAAQADRIRRQRAEAAAGRIGQSHPPAEDSITSEQIPQPATQPARQSASIPDTGTQQYPQPRTQPRPAVQPVPRSATRSTSGTATAPPVAAPTPQAVTPQATVRESAPNELANTPPPAVETLPAVAPPSPAAAQPPAMPGVQANNLLPGPIPSHVQAPILLVDRQQAENALASIEGLYSSYLGATGVTRYRSGTPGLDRLNDVEAPVEASFAFGHVARLTAVARPVFLNSGLLGSSSFASGNIPYLGTLAVNTANPPAQQYSSGVGGELQLAANNFGIAAGYTPSDFLVRNITGRFNWQPFKGPLTIFADRDSVKDTQLSYAGLRDPGVSTVQGPIWGGVISTGGGVRADFKSSNDSSDFYVEGDGATLTGRHVLDNDHVGGTAGADFRAAKWPGNASLTIGAAFTGMHFAHNESGLSYGQGGYFSPQWYLLASVPVSVRGSRGSDLHYDVRASLGMRTFQQDAAPFYPLDPLLQTGFVPPAGSTCVSTQSPSFSCGYYPQTVTTAFDYRVVAQVSYLFADHWYLGGLLSANNSNNFNDVTAALSIRYALRTQASSEGRPTGLLPIQGLRTLQIP